MLNFADCLIMDTQQGFQLFGILHCVHVCVGEFQFVWG